MDKTFRAFTAVRPQMMGLGELSQRSWASTGVSIIDREAGTTMLILITICSLKNKITMG